MAVRGLAVIFAEKPNDKTGWTLPSKHYGEHNKIITLKLS
jgi:hypothetical protein